MFVHIEIDCLRVVGNVAYMSGRITHSSNPAEGVVGELNRWSVEDNGEPGDADRVSSIPANPTNDPQPGSSGWARAVGRRQRTWLVVRLSSVGRLSLGCDSNQAA